MAASSDRGYDISQWYDSKPAKLGWLGMVGIGVFWVLYQRAFGYSHGLDSMTPEFDSVWMGLWRFNIMANALFFAVTIGWIWTTRDRNLAAPGPQAGTQAVLLLDELVDLLHLGGVLRGQLHLGAGCGVAPSDHPGHELHGEPHCGVLRDVPAVHHVRRGELSVCADAVAAV